jgi:hypothetical protein
MTTFIFEDTVITGVLESINDTTAIVYCEGTLYIFPIENIIHP